MKSIPRETNIPIELINVPNAADLWPKLLRRANPQYLAQFGIPDLVFRLMCQGEREGRNGGELDVQARAVIWHGVAARCATGVGEVTTPTGEALRQWMPGMVEKSKSVGIRCSSCGRPMRVVRDAKFSSCRKCRGASRRSEKVARAFNRVGKLPEGWKLCRRCNTPFESNREDARYCGNRCRQRASRENRKNGVSVRPPVTDNPILGVVNA